jgi:hypothetical protein
LKLKGRQFDTIEEIQAESLRLLDINRKWLIGSAPKMEETVGLVSTCGKGTTSSVMAADGPYGEFYDFYSVSPEYFGYHHVYQLKIPITISGSRTHDLQVCSAVPHPTAPLCIPVNVR